MTAATNPSKTPLVDRNEWRTPPFVFAYMNRRFNFDIDLAASAENALCETFITEDLNALVDVEWHQGNKVGWLNPPYDNITPWLRKAIAEASLGFTTVCLIPLDNGEARYGAHVHGVASEVINITGRLAYLRPDGTPVSGNNRGSCFVVYQAHNLGHTHYGHVRRETMAKMYRCAA
jgi:DNA (cytosine-5)-methyltransferase 1